MKELLLNNPTLAQDLAIIETHYGFISENITKLESDHISASRAMDILDDTIKRIENDHSSSTLIKKAFDSILDKNPDLGEIRKIVQVLTKQSEPLLQCNAQNIAY